jgi:hypothetical protein
VHRAERAFAVAGQARGGGQVGLAAEDDETNFFADDAGMIGLPRVGLFFASEESRNSPSKSWADRKTAKKRLAPMGAWRIISANTDFAND